LSDRRTFAYHEAGHGVVASVLGGVVRGIELHPYHAATDTSLVGAERRLLVALAGYQAEVEFLGSADGRDSLPDYRMAFEAAMQLAACDERTRAPEAPVRRPATFPVFGASALPHVRRAAEAYLAVVMQRRAVRAGERVKVAEVEARRLVRAHGVAIAHLAAGLERFRTFSGSDVREVIAEGLRRQAVADNGWRMR
jgi:hypothetical protein